MPAATCEAAIQAKYAALTSFSGKPPVLWCGLIRLKNPDNSAVDYPAVRFEHTGTSSFVTFAKNQIETHRYRFEVYAETRQQAKAIHDRMMFNGFAPDAAGGNGGFWFSSTLDLPAAYTLMAFRPVGDWVCEEVVGEWTGTATLLHRLSWVQELQTERISWS